jgi:2-oxoglutarate dehydrogenase E1 component
VQVVWCQEEPRNAGAYTFIADEMRTRFGIDPGYIGRPASATPAVGSKHKHKEQQEELIAEAMGPLPGEAHAGANGAAAKPAKAPKKVSTRV